MTIEIDQKKAKELHLNELRANKEQLVLQHGYEIGNAMFLQANGSENRLNTNSGDTNAENTIVATVGVKTFMPLPKKFQKITLSRNIL